MTYEELKDQVEAHRVAGEWKEIIQLITQPNVRTAVFCLGKGTPEPIQPTTRPNEMLELYKTLEVAVSNDPDTDTIMTRFLPEHIVLAEIGAEYEAAVVIAEAAYTAEGFANPDVLAIDNVTAEYDKLSIAQNAEIPGPCP